MDKISKHSLGIGATYPIYLTEDKHGKQGWNVSNQGLKLIENNLCSLLSYELGYRIRQEEFGTRLWECIEEPNTQALTFLVNTFLKEAITTWEPRIEFQRSEIFRDHHKLYIKFFYKIKSNQVINSASIEYDLEYRK